MFSRLAKALASVMLFFSLASPALATVQISAYGYGYAATSVAAYNVAYAEADQALQNECSAYVSDPYKAVYYGNVSRQYVINYNVNWNGWTWVANINLGGTCS